DLAISRSFQRLVPYNESVKAASGYVATLVAWLPIIAFAVVLLMRRWRDAALLALAGLTTLYFAEDGLKSLFVRPRPAAEYVGVYESSRGLSFPSGTALRTMVILVVVGYLKWQAGKADRLSNGDGLARFYSLLFPFCLSLLLVANAARILVGAHWISDIIGGWLFGAGWALVLCALNQWLAPRSAGAR
ncbi:MAG: phosphatase PAP2 family protein, partial [Blastocatellia bacterium]